MAVIKITNFAGEAPSLSARSLGVGFSALAKNLYARVGEFRPLQDDAVTVPTLPNGAVNPKTLFRLERKADGTLNTDMATGWITSDKVMSYAKGQINDDLTGRTYYSFDDGSAPPRVMDAGINPARDSLPVTAAVDKLLGVPAPAAPRVTLIVGDEFTPEEFDALMKLKTTEVATKVRASASYQLVGAYAVDATAPGYLASAVTGVVSVPVVTGGGGGSTGGGSVTVGGGGGTTAVATAILLGTGGSMSLSSLLRFYTSSTAVVTNLYHGEVYTWRAVATDPYLNYKLSDDGASMVFA